MLDLKKFLGLSGDDEATELVFGATDIGRVREKNEDYCLINRQKHLYIVSDGMGGHNAGEIASQNAAKTVEAYFTSSLLRKLPRNPGIIQDEINSSVKRAHQRLHELADGNPQYSGMGCTIVVALIVGNALHIGHVGDSRAYLSDDTELNLLTTDHTFVMELVKKGKMRMEDIKTSAMKNHLSQALGVPAFVSPDYSRHILKKGDKILLCTDGLWGAISEEEIFETLRLKKTQKQIVLELIHQANRAGGHDNITCVMIEPVFEDETATQKAGEYHIVFSYPDREGPDKDGG
jgi:protein phosphatase